MHDWTLKMINYEWHSARVSLELEDLTSSSKVIVAEGVRDLHVPHTNEWGQSVSVNEVSEVELLQSGLRRLRIEMQSGDVIQIVALQFTIPA
jgi:hypothetical protein